MLLLLGKWEALLQALCSEAAAAAGGANPAFGGRNTAFQWILNRKIKKKKALLGHSLLVYHRQGSTCNKASDAAVV